MADVQIDQDAANIPAINVVDQGADPTAPGAGHVLLYIKSGALYVRLSDGTIAPVGGVASLAEGQLAVGDGSGLLSALALGTAGDVVTADSSGFATWAAPTGGGGDVVNLGSVLVAGSAAASMSVTVPGGYRSLLVTWEGRIDAVSNWCYLHLNDDAGSNYKYYLVTMSATGMTAQQSSSATGIYTGLMCGTDATANRASVGRIIIPNYAGAVFHKTIQGESLVTYDDDVTHFTTGLIRGLWLSTTAITKLSLVPVAGNFIVGSNMAVWGLSV